jgi:hypothetical protein
VQWNRGSAKWKYLIFQSQNGDETPTSDSPSGERGKVLSEKAF